MSQQEERCRLCDIRQPLPHDSRLCYRCEELIRLEDARVGDARDVIQRAFAIDNLRSRDEFLSLALKPLLSWFFSGDLSAYADWVLSGFNPERDWDAWTEHWQLYGEFPWSALELVEEESSK